MKDESSPVSIRLSEVEVNKLKEIGGGKSVAAGVKELLRLYEGKALTETNDGSELLSSLEAEIKGLKDLPFGFDKNEIKILEKELEKAKEKYIKKKSESIKERLKLVNSAG